MIKAICIDDKNKPRIIPSEKWVNAGDIYTIIHVGTSMGTNILTCTLKEITLTEKEYPYEGFRLGRFGFNVNDIPALFQLIADCNELPSEEILRLIEQELPAPEVKEN